MRAAIGGAVVAGFGVDDRKRLELAISRPAAGNGDGEWLADEESPNGGEMERGACGITL